MQKLEEHLLRELRRRLSEDEIQMTKRIKELTKQDPFNDPDRINDNAASDTEASEEAGHDRVSALVDTLQKKHADITAALGRIDTGTYGRCMNCGNLMRIERLRILPATTLCLDCEQREH